MKTLLTLCMAIGVAVGAVSAQQPAQVRPEELTERTTDYIPKKFMVYDPPDDFPVPEEYHLEPWVAQIKSHYVALQAFVKVEDVRDENGNVVEWHPPMATFSR